MSEQKYLVTEDDLNGLIRNVHYMAKAYENYNWKDFNSFKLCLSEPYNPPYDWRKKWRDRDTEGRLVVYVTPEIQGVTGRYVTLNKIYECWTGHQGLISVEPVIKKVETWGLLDTISGIIFDTYTILSDAQAEAARSRHKNTKIVKLEGSYET